MSAPIIIGGCTLRHMDCMDYMRGLSDKAFDLAIVDPPYGINAPKMGELGIVDPRGKRSAKGRLNQGSGKLKNRALNTMNCEWDDQPPSPEYFEELRRVSVNQIIWGGNYFDLPATRCVVCWDKEQPWQNFSQWEMAWTSMDKPASLFRMSNCGMAAAGKIHPTQKPIALYEWLLTNYAKPGQRILDTHLGSGSSAIAANNFGFEFVGMELDADYFAAACNRIQQATAQDTLFAPEPVKQIQEALI